MTQPTPPGWYPDGQGATRYWDGTHWAADAGAPVEPPPVYAPPPVTHHSASQGSRRRMPWWQPVGIAVLILLGGVGIGTAAAGSKTAKALPAQTITATATITATPTVVQTIATKTQTLTITYTPPPPTSYGNGTYIVGTDIQPGLYKSPGGGSYCAWVRASDKAGSTIIDLGNSSGGPLVVQVMPTDGSLKIQGDCTFTKAG